MNNEDSWFSRMDFSMFYSKRQRNNNTLIQHNWKQEICILISHYGEDITL